MSDTTPVGLADPFDDLPVDDGPVGEEKAGRTLTRADVAGMGYSEEELEILRAAGVLREDSKGEPWMPQSLDDVDWWAWRLVELQREAEAIEARAKERLARLQKATDHLIDRYRQACEAIVEANLPRKKGGAYAAKSLTLDRVKVGIRTSAGGPKVVNEPVLLAHLMELASKDRCPEALVEAVRATRTETRTGILALGALRAQVHDWTPKILATPVKKHVEATGERLPGVDVMPPHDTLWWE